MNFKFNHEADELSLALGIEDNVLVDLSNKLLEIDKSMEDGEVISPSRILEKITTIDFSQEQLHILASFEVVSRIKEKQESMLEILQKMAEILKKDVSEKKE